MIRKLLFRNFLGVYRLSQWIRLRFTHTGLLIFSAIIAAIIFGLNTRQTLSYQIAAFLLSLILISLIAILFYRGRFRINRVLPEYATAGEPLEYRIIIRNDAARSHYDLTVFDHLVNAKPALEEFLAARDVLDKKRNFFDRFVGYPRLVSLMRKKRGAVIPPARIDKIEKNAVHEQKIELLPLRRGYLYFAETVIAKSDPFGLARGLIKYVHGDALLVLPRRYQMPAITLPGKRKYQHGSLNMASAVGDSEEFFSLRDYRPGDPLKAIHWRSYAKRGEPVIKEYQDEYCSRLGLVLDTFVENKADELFEDAVSVAASIAVSPRQQDQLLDLMFIHDRAWRFTTGRGLAGVDNMLEVLACVETAPAEKFNALEELIMRHVNETSGLVCVLLDWDARRRNLVRRLRQTGTHVMVLLIAPTKEIERVADDPMKDLPQYFRILKAGALKQSLASLAPVR